MQRVSPNSAGRHAAKVVARPARNIDAQRGARGIAGSVQGGVRGSVQRDDSGSQRPRQVRRAAVGGNHQVRGVQSAHECFERSFAGEVDQIMDRVFQPPSNRAVAGQTNEHDRRAVCRNRGQGALPMLLAPALRIAVRRAGVRHDQRTGDAGQCRRHGEVVGSVDGAPGRTWSTVNQARGQLSLVRASVATAHRRRHWSKLKPRGLAAVAPALAGAAERHHRSQRFDRRCSPPGRSAALRRLNELLAGPATSAANPGRRASGVTARRVEGDRFVHGRAAIHDRPPLGRRHEGDVRPRPAPARHVGGGKAVDDIAHKVEADQQHRTPRLATDRLSTPMSRVAKVRLRRAAGVRIQRR